VSPKYIHIFETGSYGRSVSDDGWEKVEPEHITVWKSAIELLATRSLRLPNCIARIEADWTPVLKKHQRHYKTMQRLHDGGPKHEKDFHSIARGFPSRKAKVKIIAEIVGGDQRVKVHAVHFAAGAIESYLHDLFLILNLCAPGSCDFYGGELTGAERPTEISLSNFFFEIALLGSFEKKWPNIKMLPLAQTIKWYDSVRPTAGQVSTNPMEKVLFALLHMSKLDRTPMIIIWLFYAFESLLQTKVGENLASLVQRLISLLELGEIESKILRNKFRSLYSIRSAIVHGGFEVTHPMYAELLDKRVDASYERIAATDYGMNTLIAAVQTIILRGWKYPSFTETVHGVPTEKGEQLDAPNKL
jgi:hypothetical protein